MAETTISHYWKFHDKMLPYYREYNKKFYWANDRYRKKKKKKMLEYYRQHLVYFKAHSKRQWIKWKDDPEYKKRRTITNKLWKARKKNGS